MAEERQQGFKWDWVVALIVILGAAMLLLVTFELWASHGEP